MRCAVATALVLAVLTGPTMAATPFQETVEGIRDIVKKQRWAAKMPLYNTRVYEHGEVTNEPDVESIMTGQHVVFGARAEIRVSKKGRVSARAIHPQGISAFAMHFQFDHPLGVDTVSELAAFRKMVALVLEPMTDSVAGLPKSRETFERTTEGIRDLLTGTSWVATMRLFETRVYEVGEVTNEHDEESILPGQAVVIPARSEIYVYDEGRVVLNVRHPEGLCVFPIRFFFNEEIGRDSDRDLAAFRQMISRILEPGSD